MGKLLRRPVLAATVAAALACALPGPAAAQTEILAEALTRPVGSDPLPDAAAAALVRRSRWEPRPENRRANRRIPTRRELSRFRARSDMPYRRHVTGRFRGTTDEILQWAAHKWGFPPDLLRGVAAIESWWRMSTRGDDGDSFGLMQMRRPWHCCLPIMARSTAFNVDYYGGILRSYYNGLHTWLNGFERGALYLPGDLWGSLGAWNTGRWHVPQGERYVVVVRRHMRERVWTRPGF